MIIERWMKERVKNEQRGMILQIYMIIKMVGMIMGKYIIKLGNEEKKKILII